MMLQKMLDGAARVAIGGHVRPDGDCIGSCLGLRQYIKEQYPDIQADVYLEEFRSVFDFLSGADEVMHEVPAGEAYDLFIALDCGDKERLGFSAVLFDGAEKTFCIDHHISNRAFADENYIFPEASSTSELVYRLIKADGVSRAAAEALYLGIVHDTGVFQYSCTAPGTMEAAADLMRTGIDAPKIIDETFYEKTYEQNRILGKALLDSTLLLDGRSIASVVSREEMDAYGVTAKDLDAVVSQLRITKGVEAAIFLYEVEDGAYKVSLRAKHDVDVSRIAQKFGGGGHKKAAGVTMNQRPEEIIACITREIAVQLAEEI